MRAWAGASAALVLGVLFISALSLPGLAHRTVLILSDGGQLAAAVTAAVACSLAASRAQGQERWAWALLAAGTGSWAAGQSVWTFYEVVLGTEVPFPSLADIGFLLFPLLATFGLLLWRGASGRIAARGRDFLDGAIIGVSLLVLSWSTTLGSVVSEGGQNWLPLALSLAYPLGDVILATVVALMLGHEGSRGRSRLVLVAGGVGCLAVSDSAYVYLVAAGSYSSGDLITAGWVFGFLFVAAGATLPARGISAHEGAKAEPVAEVLQLPARVRMLLPYVPLSAAGGSISFRIATATEPLLFDLSLGVALVVLVLLRQFLAVNENRRLLGELEVTRDQLQHQALHDPLTGLPNRALFADRVQHALAQRDVDVSLLYCDLDDFKSVNDELGHQAGDALLRQVAQRLLECVRPADTVARLGGDEFALLLEGSSGTSQVAQRLVASISEPYQLGDHTARTSVSVGIADLRATNEGTSRNHLRVLPVAHTETADRLLTRADSAMYLAKASGKGRAVHADGTSSPDSAISETYLAEHSAL